MTTHSYGSHPRRLDDLLASLSHDERERTRLLGADENSQMEARSIDRLPQTSWGTIDWEGLPLLGRREVALDADAERLLADWMGQYFSPDFRVVIFWGNLVVPSVEMPATVAALHLSDILATSHDFWVYGPGDAVIIEYYHEGVMTAGRIPDQS